MTGRPELRGVADDDDEPDTAAGAPVSAESYQRLLERVPAIIYIADAGEVGRLLAQHAHGANVIGVARAKIAAFSRENENVMEDPRPRTFTLCPLQHGTQR